MRTALFLPALLFAAPCLAQTNAANAPAAEALRRMMEAETRTAYIAREETFRADASGSSHVVKSDPRRGVRREPVRGGGRVSMIAASDTGRARQGGKRIEELFRRLSKGTLAAKIVGQDAVAGRKCDIVEVRATRLPDALTRRFWIDRETGLRLRTEEKTATGKLLSGSYYTSLDLKPTFAANDFAPGENHGKGKKAFNGLRQRLRDRRRFKSLDEAKKAGFVVAAPTYLPSGYSLRAVETTPGGDFFALRYANGLNALSLTTLPDGVPARVRPLLRSDGSAAVPFPQGRTGLFARGASGKSYLLIGELPEGQLRKVAASIP